MRKSIIGIESRAYTAVVNLTENNAPENNYKDLNDYIIKFICY